MDEHSFSNLYNEKSTTSEDTRTTTTTVLMFTTFSDNPQKQKLFSNTIRNWATFLPFLQPVLFTTNPNSSLNKLAKQYGWIVTPCPRVNKYDVPFLKDMYLKAYEILKTNLYAFVNGDIIFDNGLVKTLQMINKDLSNFNTTLISGKRHNYDVNCTTQSLEVWTQDHVHSLSDKSRLAGEMLEDYFFVTPDFPWHEIKDVVIA